MQSAVSISDLSYSVAGLEILSALSVDIPERSYFAIAGINGAGKSTLIKIILDLIRPTSLPQITLFGADNRDTEGRNQLVYLPEKFDIKRNISGRQYLDFVADVYQQKTGHEQIKQLCEQLDFPSNRLDHKAGSYSKGMVQKLGLVSCFMLQCRLIILDEPLSGLDPRARYHFKQLMRDRKSIGQTVLYSTHLLADAEDICDQFGILHDGVMKFTGTPAACIDQFDSTSLEQAYMRCING